VLPSTRFCRSSSKSQAADVDPEGAVLGARIYPQLALRYRERRNRQSRLRAERHHSRGGGERRARDAGGLDDSIKALANGKLVASAFCESNLAAVTSTSGWCANACRQRTQARCVARRWNRQGATQFLRRTGRGGMTMLIRARRRRAALAVVRASDDPAHPAQAATLAWHLLPTFQGDRAKRAEAGSVTTRS